jgi:hypothetical protein
MELSAELPGAKAKAALMAVGDASVFFDPPEAEISKKDVPSLTRRRQMLSLTVDYLKKTLPKRPDFYARRITTSFEDWIPNDEKGKHAQGVLQSAGKFRATVYYRGGKEVANAEGEGELGLVTEGTFGPILNTVIVDAAHGATEWSRWEDGPNGSMAVFRFKVPQAESHYQVSFPTFITTMGELSALEPTGYHGEIAIDPTSGTILRLVLEADPALGSPMLRADIMVEYGPVVIGEKVYTCPVRSVSIATGKSDIRNVHSEVTRLDDVVFDSYHIFRSSYRIVPYVP